MVDYDSVDSEQIVVVEDVVVIFGWTGDSDVFRRQAVQ
jgi:hypothetical protein